MRKVSRPTRPTCQVITLGCAGLTGEGLPTLANHLVHAQRGKARVVCGMMAPGSGKIIPLAQRWLQLGLFKVKLVQ